ncbi:MAG TPA: helix-turn-helix domain-containing protein [Devosiaceae bacterium]
MSRRKRRQKSRRFVALDAWLMETAAWQSLSPTERVIYVELKRRYNGSNNGYIALSVRDAASAVNVSKTTAGRALKVLEERGFIAITTQSGFNRKDRAATEYRLTELLCDRSGWASEATKEFVRWQPSEATKTRTQSHP